MGGSLLPTDGPDKRRQLAELREYIAAELGGVAWLADLRAQGGGRLVGIGGTVRNLAAAAQRAAALPSNGVQGMVIGVEALEDLIERLASLPAAERASVPGIKPARADLILAGAGAAPEALPAGGFEAIETTEAGLREGGFFERPRGSQPGGPRFSDGRPARGPHKGARNRRHRPPTRP